MADKKRKGAESKTPAKKKKVETPKTTPRSTRASPTKKVTSTKAKKPEPKKTPSKPVAKTPSRAAKTPAKESAKTPAKAAAKVPQKKETKSPEKKSDTKPAQKKVEPAVKAVTRARLAQAKSPATKMKMQLAKNLKAKAAVTAKAKLKTTAAKAKQAQKTTAKPEEKKVAVKKPEPKAESKKTETKTDFKNPQEKKETPRAKAADKKTESATKRKKPEEPEVEQPRKRRMITPNKKFADYEIEVPTSKRVITPNKKYADYETDTPSKKEKSELRTFIQDKKKTPATGKDTEESTAKTESPKKAVTEKSDKPTRDITVLKPSEMKPAEKLMKKLQKQLEKEAKSPSTPKPMENKEKAKIKITKVVTYNKPISSEEKDMGAINKAGNKTPTKKQTDAVKKRVDTALQKITEKATPKQVVKTAPKTAARAVKPPEKPQQKPKKIKEIKKEDRPIQAKFMCQLNVKLPDDNENVKCWITGISVFPSGEVIMVDMANRKIKLFSKDFEFLSQVKLDTIPQDISISPVNASDAYFTKPFSKEGIQKVTMSDGKLTLKDSFWTNGTNRGITCTKAGILTSVQDGRYHDFDINHFKIDLLDYDGNVLQSVSTDPSGTRLFKLPLYFTVNSTGKQVIVADCIKHLSYVISVDMTGRIKFKYDGICNNLVTPRGLTIDDEDNIYVTEWERHNVYILSPAGKRLQILFSNEELREEGLDGLMKPYQLCFYKRDNTRRLLVSQEGCDTVKLFTLLKKGPETEAAAAEAKMIAEKKSLPNGESETSKSDNTVVAKPVTSTEVVKSSPVKVVQSVSTVKVGQSIPAKVVQSLPAKMLQSGAVKIVQKAASGAVSKPVKIVVQPPAKAVGTAGASKPVVVATSSKPAVVPEQTKSVIATEVTKTVEKPMVTESTGTQVTDIPEPAAPVIQQPAEPVQEQILKVEKPTETPVVQVVADTVQQPTVVDQQVSNIVQQQQPEVIAVPIINAEFGDDFETAETEPEEMSSVQNAIDSLNDSKENEMETEQIVATPVSTNQIQVQIYDQGNVPQTEMVSILPQSHQIAAQHHQMSEAMQVQSEGMEVQQVEFVASDYQQGVDIPQVEQMTAEAVMGSEVHSVPVQNVGQQTIVYQQGDQYIVTVPDNSGNGVLQTDNVQYVTSVGLPGEAYATSISQGEAITEIPDDMVAIVAENV